jgi:uncharacterized repeat protein (TIGR01451 family)
MLRVFVRVGAALGLTALVLVLAGNVLAMTTARSGAAPTIGRETPPRAASIAPEFSVALSAVAAGGLTQPVGIANAGDGSGRLFVLEQAGYIRIIKNGALLPTPYLTLTTSVACCGEQGLLGLEFDPDFGTNGIFYVNFTTNAGGFSGDTVVVRYQVANPTTNVASVIMATPIITIEQPQGNHNGGDLHFSPSDGYLYIGMGDGGGSNDVGTGHAPEGNGQSPATWLGKILRLNVRNVPTYTVPPTNPFTQTANYKPEIWSLGWRNPWRFSFDRATGDMYIGDVGQKCWEEISYEPGGQGGRNYGWRLEEGFRQFDPNNASDCNMPVSTLITTTKPITAYGRSLGSAVTGGFVYRGQQYPWMHGVYFYGDSGSGRIWAIQQINPGVWSGSEKLDTPYRITAFGEDEVGELYVASYGDPNTPGTGGIYKITSTSPIDFSASTKKASASTATAGGRVTYTIVVRNTGGPLGSTVRMTDVIPTGLAYATGTFTATHGSVDASGAPTLKWNGVMSPTPIVTLTYAVTVTTSNRTWLVNHAVIDPGEALSITRTAPIIANPLELFLPLILRNN